MITDFVLSLNGHPKVIQLSWLKDPTWQFTGKYFARKKLLNQERQLFVCQEPLPVHCGDITPTRDEIIADMRRQAGGKFEKSSVLCIYGSSNGASVALAVAAELQNELTVKFICLSDLPMFASGRQPGISGIGDCRVSNPVHYDVVESKKTLNISFQISRGSVRPENDCPRVTLNFNFNAKEKRNYWQNNGNTIKPFIRQNGWYWGSSMPNSEVHGEVTGWNNIKLDMSKSNLEWYHAKDGQYHANLNDSTQPDFNRDCADFLADI